MEASYTPRIDPMVKNSDPKGIIETAASVGLKIASAIKLFLRLSMGAFTHFHEVSFTHLSNSYTIVFR